MLIGLSALPVARAALAANPVAAVAAGPLPLPSQPSLLVAGPASGTAERWAEVIAPPLGQSLTGTGPLPWDNVGGADGVTGANAFGARQEPDGACALLVPGAALLAALVGDTRVRFDPGGWAPLWAGRVPACVVSRVPLQPGRPVRVAVRNVAGPELAALLALQLMGLTPVPAPEAEADARLRVGPALVTGAIEPGWRPAFALGSARDPSRPDVPAAAELFAAGADPALVSALGAVTAAIALEVALVLPAMVPATVLAWWRRGCDGLDDAPPLRAAAARATLRIGDAGTLAAELARMELRPEASLALRSLLAERYGWRPA